MHMLSRAGRVPFGLALGRLASLAALWAAFLFSLYAGYRLTALTGRDADLGWGVSNSYWSYLDHAMWALSLAALLIGCMAMAVTVSGLVSLIVSRWSKNPTEWPDHLVSAANLLAIVLLSWSTWTSTHWAFPTYGYAVASASTLSLSAALAVVLVGFALTIPGLCAQADG